MTRITSASRRRQSTPMESSYSITYEHMINNRKIRIYFTCMDLNVDKDMSKYVEYIRTILMWFDLISHYSTLNHLFENDPFRRFILYY